MNLNFKKKKEWDKSIVLFTSSNDTDEDQRCIFVEWTNDIVDINALFVRDLHLFGRHWKNKTKTQINVIKTRWFQQICKFTVIKIA